MGLSRCVARYLKIEGTPLVLHKFEALNITEFFVMKPIAVCHNPWSENLFGWDKSALQYGLQALWVFLCGG